jgi:hypothetical protein
VDRHRAAALVLRRDAFRRYAFGRLRRGAKQLFGASAENSYMEPNRTEAWALDWLDALGILFVLILFAAFARAAQFEDWYVPLFAGVAFAFPAARRRWLGWPRGVVRRPGTVVDLAAAFMISLGVLVGAIAVVLLVLRRGELYEDLGDAQLIVVLAASIPCVLVGRLIDRRRMRRESSDLTEVL